jgi:hypothetical protein
MKLTLTDCPAMFCCGDWPTLWDDGHLIEWRGNHELWASDSQSFQLHKQHSSKCKSEFSRNAWTK